MKKIAFLFFLQIFLFTNAVHADIVQCENLKIKDLFVQGERDDLFGFHNKLTARFSNPDGSLAQCGDFVFVYIENTANAFPGMLSTLLAANMAGKSVTIGVNTNKKARDTTSQTNANQLAYVGFSNQ